MLVIGVSIVAVDRTVPPLLLLLLSLAPSVSLAVSLILVQIGQFRDIGDGAAVKSLGVQGVGLGIWKKEI